MFAARRLPRRSLLDNGKSVLEEKIRRLSRSAGARVLTDHLRNGLHPALYFCQIRKGWTTCPDRQPIGKDHLLEFAETYSAMVNSTVVEAVNRVPAVGV